MNSLQLPTGLPKITILEAKKNTWGSATDFAH